jgi:hypothetical protein
MRTALGGRRKILSILALLAVLSVAGCSSRDWRTASRQSAGLAPDPHTTHEAVLQVYGAQAWGWRGWFAIHTWVATKKSGAAAYTVFEVIGWRERHGQPVLRIEQDVPDRYWFGEKPELLRSVRGQGVDRLIDKVEQSASRYPWHDDYAAFPGPNSNTFTAWIARQVPELNLELPFRAIGSGYVD